MKPDRHTAIREIIAASPVLNQHELRRRLARKGFEVTQATLSRDIRELRIYKGPNGYTLPNGAGTEEEDDQPSIDEVLSTFALRAKQAQNQVVVTTTQGGAQPVAYAIDHEDWPEVVGTIAGDDTVLVICPDKPLAAKLLFRLEEMIG